MGLSGVRVVHAIPGRIRLKIPQVRGNSALAAAVEARLSGLAGVRRVEANPVTGSVLVLFETTGTTAADSLATLSETWPSELGVLELHAGAVTNGSGNGKSVTPGVDRRLVEFFGSVNTGVSDVTSGFDLKLLVPLALFFLGVRSLLVTEKLLTPTWYDLFWFGLSTFVMLNRSAIEGAGGSAERRPARA